MEILKIFFVLIVCKRWNELGGVIASSLCF